MLIMDDEAGIRTLAYQWLSESGYQVQVCCNGEEVVELYRNCWESGELLPVVLLDLLVPGAMGGQEAAKRILSIDPHARMIVSSGYSDDPLIVDYDQFGFSATLSKPYNTDDLLRVIQNVQRL